MLLPATSTDGMFVERASTMARLSCSASVASSNGVGGGGAATSAAGVPHFCTRWAANAATAEAFSVEACTITSWMQPSKPSPTTSAAPALQGKANAADAGAPFT